MCIHLCNSLLVASGKRRPRRVCSNFTSCDVNSQSITSRQGWTQRVCPPPRLFDFLFPWPLFQLPLSWLAGHISIQSLFQTSAYFSVVFKLYLHYNLRENTKTRPTWWHVISSADQTKIPERTWAVTVFRKISSSTSVPFSDMTTVMLDLVEMLDSSSEEERESELLMLLSESILQLPSVVFNSSSIWGGKNKTKTLKWRQTCIVAARRTLCIIFLKATNYCFARSKKKKKVVHMQYVSQTYNEKKTNSSNIRIPEEMRHRCENFCTWTIWNVCKGCVCVWQVFWQNLLTKTHRQTDTTQRDRHDTRRDRDRGRHTDRR